MPTSPPSRWHCGPPARTRARSTAGAARRRRRRLLAFQERDGPRPRRDRRGRTTKRALGPLGRPELGARSLALGTRGWDVAELQFKLAWHGFPSGPFDGTFGPRLDAAVRRFQRFADLPTIGIAGPRTMAALDVTLPTSPLDLSAPGLRAEWVTASGRRGDAFHCRRRLRGLGPARQSSRHARAASCGRPPLGASATPWSSVTDSGVRTLYAHLARIDVGLLEPRLNWRAPRPGGLDRALNGPAPPLRGARPRRGRRPARRSRLALYPSRL